MKDAKEQHLMRLRKPLKTVVPFALRLPPKLHGFRRAAPGAGRYTTFEVVIWRLP